VSHDSGLSPAADAVGLGHPLLDRYAVFVASRARANTVAATVSDLRVFFSVVDKDPRQVTASDVLDFIAVQRRPQTVSQGVGMLL
jgi:integrase/recombinase XerD